MSREHPRKGPPRAVSAWLVAANLFMACALVFVALQINSLVVYVAGAPLLVAFLVTAGTYAWLLFRR